MNTVATKITKIVVSTIVAAMALMVLGSPAAHARPDDGGGNDGGGGQSGTSTCTAADTADQKYLAMNRWIDGTNDFHTRFDLGVTNLNDVAANAQRSVQGVMFSFGNSLYSITGSLTGWANKFCPLTTLGGTVDKAAATVANAVLDSGIAVTIVVLLVFSALFSGLSRESGMARNNFRKVLSKVIIIGIMAAMMAGAQNSTGGGINGSDAPYKPGTLSPGWVAITIDDIITSVAMTPALALTSTCEEDGSKNTGGGGCGIANDPMGGAQLDCGPYRQKLNEMYLADAKDKSVVASKYIPGMVVSNMWQITGYRAWTVAQYGDQNGNGWSRVACHQLDIQSGVPAKGDGDMGSWDLAGTDNKDNDLYYSYAVTAAVLGDISGMDRKEAVAQMNGRAPAWRGGENDVEFDKALVAWAACMPPGDGGYKDLTAKEGWRTPKGNEYLIHDGGEREKASKGESKKLDAACYAFFNEDKNPDGGMFDWGDGRGKIDKDAKDAPASVKAFLVALHGNYVPGAAGAVLAHNVAALCTLIVFGGLSLVQIVIKVLMVVMLFFTFIVMMMVLLPNGDTSKLKRYIQQYIGLALFSAFSILILSVVVLFTGVILQLVGNASGGPTTLMSMLAGGVAPVVSVIGIHFVFKKMGMPSPVTMKGGLGWGAALAGGAGFAAMSNGVGALQDKARAGASRVGSALGNKTADGTYRKFLNKGKQSEGGGGDQKASPKGTLGEKSSKGDDGVDKNKDRLDKDGKPLDLDKRTDRENRQEAGAAWAHAVGQQASRRKDRFVAGAANLRAGGERAVEGLRSGGQRALTGAQRLGALTSYAWQNKGDKATRQQVRTLAGQTALRGVKGVGSGIATGGRAAFGAVKSGASRGWADAKGNMAAFAGATTSERLSMVGRGVVKTGKRAAIVGGAAALGAGALAAAPVALPGLAAGAGIAAAGGVLAKRVGGEDRATRRERVRNEQIEAYRDHRHQRGEAVLAAEAASAQQTDTGAEEQTGQGGQDTVAPERSAPEPEAQEPAQEPADRGPFPQPEQSQPEPVQVEESPEPRRSSTPWPPDPNRESGLGK